METLIRIKPPVFPVEDVNIPEASSVRLDNGIPIFMIESGKEEIMRIEFTFKAGQVKENLPLLSSSTNMMLTEGSQNYSSEELSGLIDFYGSFLNQSYEKDRAGIVIYLLNKHLEKILELSREILFRPVFPDIELKSLMKKRHRWFLVNREKVQKIAQDQFFESVFGKNHPYGHQVTESDFERISPDLLRDFHTKHYSVDNMAIIISGKIRDDTAELLNLHFGDLKANGSNSQANPVKSDGDKKRKVHISKPGAVQTAMKIGSKTINKREQDYPGLKVLDTILGGYFGSRLMKNIREEKGYTYGISSGVYSLDLSGYIVISTEVSQKNSLMALNEIYKEIKLLQTEPVNSAEIEVVRNYMSGEMLRMFDGPFALAESFRSAWEFGLDNDYYYRLAEKIRTIGADEIIDLARTYYNIDGLYEITVGQE